MKLNISLVLSSLLLVTSLNAVVTGNKTLNFTVNATPVETGGANESNTGTDSSTTATSATTWQSRKTTNGTPQADDILYGAGSKNKVHGLADNDKIRPVNASAWDSKSKYYGDDGDDWIETCRGSNLIAYGGNGNDTLIPYHGTQWQSNNKFYGGNGNDKFYTTTEGTGMIFYGDAGFDTIVLTGNTDRWYITFSSWSNKYTFRYRASGTPSTWNYDSKFDAYNIEKWIFSTTGVPPAPGLEDPVAAVWYIDPANPTTVNNAPTAGLTATMPTVNVYKQLINLQGNVGDKAYIRYIPRKIIRIEDQSGNAISTPFTLSEITHYANSTDLANDVKTVDAVTYDLKFVLTGTNSNYYFVTEELQITQAELDKLRISTSLPTGGF
jgi:hypothetical protein